MKKYILDSYTNPDLVELVVGRDQELLCCSMYSRQMDKQGLFGILLSNVVVRLSFLGTFV